MTKQTASQIIVAQTDRHYAVSTRYGYDIYRNEGTAAVRCARIGYRGDKGMSRVMAEIARREMAA